MFLRPFLKNLTLTFDMIKIQHSVFALPFALASLLYATDGHPDLKILLLVVLCMITARNAAMSFNRYVDRDIDAKNPRTCTRAIPAGTLSAKFCGLFAIANSFLFILLAASINTFTAKLSPFALLILLGYSLTKRFTNYTQFFLGLSLGIAPIAAWIAATNTLHIFPLLLGLGVLLWVAGFDLIYSCQDYAFDKSHGLKNIVVKWGIATSLRIARILHFSCMICFLVAGYSFNCGPFFFFGLFIIGLFLIYEHTLVKSDDLSKVNAAFFTMNGYISLCFLFFSWMDLLR